MENKNNTAKSGVGIATVVFIVFLILKLTKVINWSWWWIFSPLWISAALEIILLAVLGIMTVIAIAKERKAGKSDDEIIDDIDNAVKD